MPEDFTWEEGVEEATDIITDPGTDINSVYKVLMELPFFDPWERERMTDIYGFASDIYGDPTQYVNKGNVMWGIGKSLMRNALGMDIDPLAGKFKTGILDYYYKENRTEEDHKEILEMFRAYQDEYGILDEKGVKIAEDLIMSGSLDYKFLKTRADLIAHTGEAIDNQILSTDYDLEDKWNPYEVTRDKKFDVSDVLRYIHGGVSEEYRRADEEYRQGE